MTDNVEYLAWNNFVQGSYPPAPSLSKVRHAAAIANLYMGAANNGGINSFLTVTPELNTNDVLDALLEMNMIETAAQFKAVIVGLGQHLVASSSDERWRILEERWTDEMDYLDGLTPEADAELMRLLEAHVSEHEEYYAAMNRP
ncbi:hypothetical protein ACFOKF_08650 [Sphingobium rhizovicinum]|uniref:DNA mimic protein DMP19 C-terminal domain-containing protein n=1 Tax=Sphingobium rhizovicinum TaxID=432308 RepID=A0ABV7NE38_9SPHN